MIWVITLKFEKELCFSIENGMTPMGTHSWVGFRGHIHGNDHVRIFSPDALSSGPTLVIKNDRSLTFVRFRCVFFTWRRLDWIITVLWRRGKWQSPILNRQYCILWICALSTGGPPSCYGKNGTCCFYQWEHEQFNKGTRGQSGFWGAIRHFL